MTVRIKVDRDHCERHGQCVGRVPAAFWFTDAGELEHAAEVGDELADEVDDAVFLCPVQAIEVIRE